MLWKKCETHKEKKIILEHAKVGFIISLIYFVLILVIFFGYAVVPVLIVLMSNWLSVNNYVGRSYPIFFSTFLQQNVWIGFCFLTAYIFIIVVIISTLNYLQMSVAKYIVGMLAYLGDDMIHMHEVLESTHIPLTNKQKMKIINRKICNNIRKHQECIKLFESLQLFAKEKYFIVTILTILQISLSGVWFVVIIPYDKMYAIKIAASIVSSLAILLYLIYASQELINACDQFKADCYDAKWYMFPWKERRLLLLMILRSENSCTLTAGPTILMNFETCGNIMKMVLSYLTAFHRILENNNFSMDTEKSYMLIQSYINQN
ncbi:hypothetical protein TKK_0010655 [Trichogramma kaykai]